MTKARGLQAVLMGVLVLASAMTGFARAVGQPNGSFPCQWRWGLQAGLRAGYVTATSTADCGGREGALTLGVRLLRWNPKTRTWHTDRAATRTWRDLRASRYVAVGERCTTSTVRAEFDWILRETGGTVVARHSVRTGTLKVPGPDCRIGIA